MKIYQCWFRSDDMKERSSHKICFENYNDAVNLINSWSKISFVEEVGIDIIYKPSAASLRSLAI